MSKVFDFSGHNDFCRGGFLFQNPKESSSFLSLTRHVDVYFPPRKRSRISAPFVVSEEPKQQPSIEILPDECLFEVLRRLPGGQERITCASVSKRWLMLLSSICKSEICVSVTTQSVEPEIKSDPQKEDRTAKPKEKDESCEVGVEAEEFAESDSVGYLSRCLEGKKASDVRLAAISVRGGLDKLSLRGNSSTCRLTNLGLKAISRGCPSLKTLSLWNLSSVGDEGLAAIATGCRSLEKLDLSHCPAVTDKALIAIAMSCKNLKSVTLESCSNIGNESLKALGSYCPKLTCIVIKNCPGVGDQGIAGLFSSAGHVIARANLQALNITDMSLAVIGHYGSAMTDLILGALQNVNERGFWVMGKGQGLQKLRSLAVVSCQGVSDASLDAIGRGCPNLKLLGLKKCPLVSDNGVVSVVKGAGSLECLKLDEVHRVTQRGLFGVLANCGGKFKAISLANCLGLQDMDVEFSTTSVCCSLRSLAIQNCPGFGDLGLAMLGRMCPKVSHVDLTGLQGVTNCGVLPLVQRPESCLVKVNLSGCVNITEIVVSQIAEVHGKTIRTLNLDGCRFVGDVSMVSIARNCSTLSELHVSRCGITDYGVAALAGAEHLCLQVLSLAGSAVSDRSLPFLKKIGQYLVGLNIQHCPGITPACANLLVENLWRCDILS